MLTAYQEDRMTSASVFELVKALQTNWKIEAIKVLRVLTASGLKETTTSRPSMLGLDLPIHSNLRCGPYQ